MLKTRGNRITWLGHATFKITLANGKVVLLEGWVDGNPACPKDAKKLDRVDTILLTHGHSDHLGDAISIAKKFKSQVFAIFETAAWLESKGVKNVTGMGKGGTVKAGEIEATMVHAIHSNSIHDGDKMTYGGEPAGYIVRLPGGLTIYHAGDTAVFGDMKLIGELYAPEVAMLPIGDFYTMGPREAAHAIRLLNVKHVIPMHYATFPVLTGTPEELKKLTQDIAGLEIHAIKPGESLA
ncbi:MAG TPA: metal-dependent hydrolase [Candidatus Acidoferrales bacterium]|nr:metal-dependent hydrolase [Candidatus Acidoferrales bacterium]